MYCPYGETEIGDLKRRDKRLAEVIDRIGSGDAYLAGVLFQLLKTGDLQQALEQI